MHTRLAAHTLVANRRLALIVAAISFTVLAGFGLLVAGDHTPTSIDTTVDVWILERFRHHYVIPQTIADIGGVLPVAVATAGLAGSQWMLRRLRGIALACLTPVVAVGLTDLVYKPLFDRRLEVNGGSWLAYPSGHETALCSVLMVAVLLALQTKASGRFTSVAALTVLVAPVVAVIGAVGLIGAGYHYASDTVGGMLVAISTALGVGVGTDVAFDRYLPSR